jgi:hypothetical protein
VCFALIEKCKGVVEDEFEKVYGPMTDKDKVIFAIFDMPDTTVFSSITDYSLISVKETEFLGDRRFKLTVHYDNQLLGYRYSTVREFNV